MMKYIEFLSGALDWMTSNGGLAGWVQAIGSILAILAAALIAGYQTSHAKRVDDNKRREIEIQRFNIIKALMVRSHILARDVIEAFKTPSSEKFDQISPSLMRDTGSTLVALPIFEVPLGTLALDVMTVGRGMQELAKIWDDLIISTRAEGTLTPADIEPLLSLAEELFNISEDAIKNSKTAISERGGPLT